MYKNRIIAVHIVLEWNSTTIIQQTDMAGCKKHHFWNEIHLHSWCFSTLLSLARVWKTFPLGRFWFHDPGTSWEVCCTSHVLIFRGPKLFQWIYGSGFLTVWGCVYNVLCKFTSYWSIPKYGVEKQISLALTSTALKRFTSCLISCIRLCSAVRKSRKRFSMR